MPRVPQSLPVSPEQAQYNLPLSEQDRAALIRPSPLAAGNAQRAARRAPIAATCR